MFINKSNSDYMRVLLYRFHEKAKENNDDSD